MRILRSIMLGIAMVAVCGVANAAKVTRDVPFSSNYVIKTYIAAVTQGKLDGFEKILDNNATFTTMRNGEEISLKREDVLSGLKANEGIAQDCTTTTSVSKETIENTVYEVDIKYADYVQAHFITLAGTDESGWKITNVRTVNK